MPFPMRHIASKSQEKRDTSPKESPVLQRELIRIYAQKLNAVTSAMNASLTFGDALPGVGALMTSIAREEAGDLRALGELLPHVQIPVLPPQAAFPQLESPAESAKRCLELLCEEYRIRAEHYRRAGRFARLEQTSRVLEQLAAGAHTRAEALLSMHARLCRS